MSMQLAAGALLVPVGAGGGVEPPSRCAVGPVGDGAGTLGAAVSVAAGDVSAPRPVEVLDGDPWLGQPASTSAGHSSIGR